MSMIKNWKVRTYKYTSRVMNARCNVSRNLSSVVSELISDERNASYHNVQTWDQDEVGKHPTQKEAHRICKQLPIMPIVLEEIVALQAHHPVKAWRVACESSRIRIALNSKLTLR